MKKNCYSTKDSTTQTTCMDAGKIRDQNINYKLYSPNQQYKSIKTYIYWIYVERLSWFCQSGPIDQIKKHGMEGNYSKAKIASYLLLQAKR